MLATLIAPTILIVILCVIGFAWVLTTGGGLRVQGGSEIGAGMISKSLCVGEALSPRPRFKGK